MRVYLDARLHALGVTFSAPNPGDAGYDLYALEPVTIPSGAQTLIPTGVYLEIPTGYVGLVKDRSSMALAGLRTAGGVIDASYRGEIKVIMSNVGATEYAVRAGHKIAQIVIIPCYTAPVETVESPEALTATERGDDGFGSTGL